jgi:hypothetical protein
VSQRPLGERGVGKAAVNRLVANSSPAPLVRLAPIRVHSSPVFAIRIRVRVTLRVTLNDRTSLKGLGQLRESTFRSLSACEQFSLVCFTALHTRR